MQNAVKSNVNCSIHCPGGKLQGGQQGACDLQGSQGSVLLLISPSDRTFLGNGIGVIVESLK